MDMHNQKFLQICPISSCGQGHCRFHDEHPFFKVLWNRDWRYTHTTKVTLGCGPVGIHTYKRIGTEHVVSVCYRADAGQWVVSAHKLGSGHTWYAEGCTTPEKLRHLQKYLTYKTKEFER